MESTGLILGLDIGVRSVGWALLDLKAKEIKGLGVRVFDAGVEGNVEKGRDTSKAASRREARLRRRQTERQVRKQVKLAHILQDAGLLPKGKISNPAERHQLLSVLDRQIGESYSSADRGKLPYILRAAALHVELEPFELGRALYHLAQRRGYKSNRKSDAKVDEKQGKVKPAIHELEKNIISLGAETLGEYLAMQDSPKVALRKQYTSRDMYQDEFEAIWSEQAKYHPALLTEALKANVSDAIFFQRPLKSQAHLVGKCQLEPSEKRAPWALPIAQRYRMLQTVNTLKVIAADGKARELSAVERAKLLEKLECSKKQSFDEIRKCLKLGDDCSFNLEQVGRKEIPGNKTAALLASAFTKKKWASLPEEDKQRIYAVFNSEEDEDKLIRIAQDEWKLDEKQARKIAGVSAEDGYCRLSEIALKRLLPYLEDGKDLESAIRKEYPESRMASEKCDYLPPVLSTAQLRNPAVTRALTEVRKVVNAIVREYGLPETIRIELARDIKRNREERQNISRKIAGRTKERDAARTLLQEDFNLAEPKSSDIEKYLLWQECSSTCPYCGNSIAGEVLFSGAAHIDHIIPRKVSLDNSFVNKVLCCSKCNSDKTDRTPHEAFSGDAQRWEKITKQVGTFRSDFRREKLKRVLMTREEAKAFYTDFTDSQLNDTKYASREAGDYLGILYGGRVDDNGTTRVQMTKGGITSELRNALQLGAIPDKVAGWVFDEGGKGGKDRGDHRQHAIDAVAIALSSPGIVKPLMDAYASSETAKKEMKKDIWASFAKKAAWNGFSDNVVEAVNGISISRRPKHRVRGKLFDENPLSEKGAARKSGDISEAYIRIGKDEAHSRLLKSAGNHHIEIYETANAKGKKEWKGKAVTLYEAHNRVIADEPVVNRNHGPNTRFLFSLAVGDTIELGEKEERKLYNVCSVWEDEPGSCRIEYMPLNDATIARGVNARLNPLRKLGCKKVEVSPLGEHSSKRHYQND